LFDTHFSTPFLLCQTKCILGQFEESQLMDH
jgi:hypothetical protein